MIWCFRARHPMVLLLLLLLLLGSYKRIAIVRRCVVQPSFRTTHSHKHTYSSHSLRARPVFVSCGFSPLWSRGVLATHHHNNNNNGWRSRDPKRRKGRGVGVGAAVKAEVCESLFSRISRHFGPPEVVDEEEEESDFELKRGPLGCRARSRGVFAFGMKMHQPLLCFKCCILFGS